MAVAGATLLGPVAPGRGNRVNCQPTSYADRTAHAHPNRACMAILAVRRKRVRARGCRACRRHRRNHGHLHSGQRGDAEAARIPEGERFGQLFGATIGRPDARSSLSFTDVVAYQAQTGSFDVFGWFRPETYTLTSPGAPQHLQGAAVTTSLAHNLGVQPALGRWFVNQTGAVISAGLWRRLAATRPWSARASSSTSHRNDHGVMPPRFRLPEIGHGGDNVLNDVWIALDHTGTSPGSRDSGSFSSPTRG